MPLQTARIKNKKFTYQDYVAWDDEKRWEIIDGEATNMAPAPTPIHQRMGFVCQKQLEEQLAGKKCVAFSAPTDVVLSDDNVVQPDIFVVCKKGMIEKDCIRGAPTLVVEILSPSTALKDKREKKILYENFGVKEYILIDPEESYAERYFLRKNQYQAPEIFGEKEDLSLVSLKGVKLNLKEIFEVKKTLNFPTFRVSAKAKPISPSHVKMLGDEP